jgi:hypothetical protein
MAKKRVRGPVREPSRAEIKAFERRALVTTPTRTEVDRPIDDVYVPEEPARPRQGVLPPRPSRVALPGPALSREQEMAYIRADLRRMTVLGVGLTVLIIALAFILPLLNL